MLTAPNLMRMYVFDEMGIVCSTTTICTVTRLRIVNLCITRVKTITKHTNTRKSASVEGIACRYDCYCLPEIQLRINLLFPLFFALSPESKYTASR